MKNDSNFLGLVGKSKQTKNNFKPLFSRPSRSTFFHESLQCIILKEMRDVVKENRV